MSNVNRVYLHFSLQNSANSVGASPFRRFDPKDRKKMIKAAHVCSVSIVAVKQTCHRDFK